ncbi:MAG: peptidylprolyl isomerase [Acidobacteriia bacterium]|nr:peptidylprolyl isomerase [Terriglobia bacterium]
MLDIMRRKKRLKLILWLVIISLGMGMLLLFVPGQNVGIQGFDNSIATVAGETISVKDYSDTYRHFVENYSAGGRNRTDPEILKRLGVDKQALNALIQVRVVTYAAKRLGLDVTTDEVRQAIETNPNLRNQAGFIGVDAYKALLAANRIEITEFEDSVRFMLLSKKVTNLLADSLSIPEKQLRENFARQNQEAQVLYVLFDKEAAKKKVNPTEADLRAYFEANKEKYHIKEERRAQYLLLPISDIAATQKVTDREIDDAWARMDRQETVDASHILFKVDDPSKDAEVKAKAEEILKRAKAGENFAELAKKYSQDEGSAPQGGNLGPFPQGRMPKAFEAAAFSLKPGEISDLVRTEVGYHIIKVLSHEKPNKEAERPNLIRSVQVDKAVEIAKQKAAEAQKLLEKQKDLASVAKELNVPAKIQETGFFNRSSDPAANGLSQEFIDEVFRLKEINSLGKAVELPAGQAIPKLLQINLPKPPEFKESQEAVKKDYIESKASELLQEQAQKLSDEAKKLSDLTKAAQKAGIAVKTSDSFKRDGTPAKEIGSAPDFTAAAFGLAVGGISGPITIAGGKQAAVLQLKSLSPFNETEYAKQRPMLREQALLSAREAYFDEYIRRVTDDLTKKGQIRINTNALDQFTGYRY